MTKPRQTVIEAEAMLFSDLFHQGRFAVPWHQRYYDWKPGDVRALLYDIDDAVKENRDCYFLGAVMLVRLDHGRWEINDGQQRMVTISLICAALCRRFAQEAKGSQREGLALRMIFDLDAHGAWTMDDVEHYVPRISPPRNDLMRYRQMVRGNTIGTNGALTAAWAEIERFVLPMTQQKSKDYFDFLLRKLEVACLWVPSHVDPNAVYETINCRGKQLDDLDLIRNFLYSHFNSKSDFERKDTVHQNLERIRTVIPSAGKASAYMRCRLQCKFGYLRKDHFYRDVRHAVRSRYDEKADGEVLADHVFQLTREITAGESLELFRMITASTPDPDFIRAFEVASETTKSSRNLAVFLRELRGYTVTQPLVFATLSWYIREADGQKRRRIAKVANRNLKRLAAFVLRTAFVAPKFEPSHFETEFSNYARDIASGSDIPDVGFAEFLRDCDRSAYGVLDDEKFVSAMTEARMTGTGKIKQFLLGVNAEMQSDARLLDERYCTIEHILPKSPQHWGDWSGFIGKEPDSWVHRTGNLTLMGATDNKPGPKYNGNFSKKRETYGNSGVALTREIAKYADWTPMTIEDRQHEMAKRAVRVWAFT